MANLRTNIFAAVTIATLAFCGATFAQDHQFDDSAATPQQIHEKARASLAGEGVQQSDKEAVRLYWAAVDLGVLEAITELGVMYYLGSGVPKYDQQASKLLSKAASLGDAQAQYLVALLFTNDAEKKVELLLFAASQGHLEARKVLQELHVPPPMGGYPQTEARGC